MTLRILHLTPSIHPRDGGLAADTLGTALAQRALGVDAEVWTHDSPASLAEAQETLRFPADLVTRFPTIRGGLGLSLAMEAAIVGERGRRFGVVHQHGIWRMLSRASVRWGRHFGRPVVVGPQGSFDPAALQRAAWKKRLALATYEGTNLRRAACLIANSRAEADRLHALAFGNAVALVPNGIPDEWLASRGEGARFREANELPHGPRICLFLGRIHPIKGLPLLVEACAALGGERDGWLFVIAGPDEGGHAAELRALARRLGVASALRFVGAAWDPQAKRDAYAAASLAVLPSYSESFGITVCEALGAGVPVLTTTGTPWEELARARAGWWVPPTVAGIRDALRLALVMAEPELQAMGARGKADIARRFTWSSVGRQTLELYAWLRDGGPAPDFVVAGERAGAPASRARRRSPHGATVA